ncbi:hypothetical protein FACS1894127_5270 [Clostridia bacterium]|nr:hypothetical protein FACS1894127_5270 [Clostridia bacterium]
MATDKIVQIYKSFDPTDTEEYSVVQEYDIDEEGHESGTIDWETEDGSILRIAYSGSEEAGKILNDIMLEYINRGLILEEISDGITAFKKQD